MEFYIDAFGYRATSTEGQELQEALPPKPSCPREGDDWAGGHLATEFTPSSKFPIEKPMQVRIIKTEYGLAVPIPEEMLVASKLKEGDTVNLYFCAGKLTIADPSEPYYTIEELLAGVTPENIHPEVDWGPPMGKEIW